MSGTPSRWYDPYAGLPVPVQVLMWFLLAVILATFLSVGFLMARAWFELRRQRRDRDAADESDFLWVFVVPALNEEVTIADSVSRLHAVEATHRVILVMDDGSDDRTPEILAGLDAPGLEVVRREPPRARTGKSAALDHAWEYIRHEVLARPEFASWPRDRVVVGVVDADGRLAPDGLPAIAGALARDERVAGVQVLVRIYNRGRYLTWAQDVEFGVTAYVYQLGRSAWGTANLGGNGQFTRLTALDDVATDANMPAYTRHGPWRDRLTEDQDIGVRMHQAGWRCVQLVVTRVDQQGLTNLRRLVKQRVRWAQGAWQSVALLRGVGRGGMSPLARVDTVIYLLMPALQLVMGLGLVLALFFFAFRDTPFVAGWPVLLFLLALAFFPGIAALTMTPPPGLRQLPRALIGVLPYLAYTWLTWIAFPVSLLRQTLGITGWTKTAREPLDANLPDHATLPEDPPGPGGS
ncbi:glycosyltransferase [Streptomyces sp. HNM0574]|uniref:glycosyltransferase n=1 Tax=Streptomyces sp. HNM0574 TaxID=2714954 RepID=UPI00146A7B70|nr:glycosyltransferase [Streptomyces sp. HNM0574]NLU68822.1 glycosyltransferase [Streptomyces sp. HNM0574]